MSKLEEIQIYRNDPSLNYSTLKQILENKKTKFKGSLAATLGNVVDCLLTMPEHFDDLYEVRDVKRPTEKIVGYIEDYFESLDEDECGSMSNHLDNLILKCREEGYGGSTYKDETIKTNLLKLEYWWDILCEKLKKEFITQKEYFYGKKLVNILKTTDPGLSVLSNDVYFQVPLFGTMNVRGEEIPIKSLPDIIYEKDGYICYVDLKTTAFSNWGDAVKKQHLMLQMCITYHLLKQIYQKEVRCAWLVCNGYKVKLIPCCPKAIEFGLQSSRTIKESTYSPTNQVVKEIYNPSVSDLIATYLDCKAHNLPDWDLEHFQNGGFYNFLNIYE